MGNFIKTAWDSWDLPNETQSNPMGNLIKTFWGLMDSWALSNEIPSSPMGILSKSTGIHGIHGIYPMKSHQIQWESYQNLMGFMKLIQRNPIKSNGNLIKI